MTKKARLATCVAISLALLVSACAGSDSDGAGGGGTADEGTPQQGGTLTMSLYLPTSSLDPVVAPGFGVAGGIELLAVYDAVMHWDPETGDYEPRMAESLVPNDDHSEWTLTLKEGITFTDGTPFDAEAVKFSLDRHRVGADTAPPCEETRSCPSTSVASASYMVNVADTEVVDPLTLKITTHGSWPAFPLVLAGEPGMVPSPTAVKAACAPEVPVRECDFGMNPVGAGPFKVASFKPGEEVTLERNDDFYGGDVYLDRVKFVSYGDIGGTKSSEALVAGSTDVAFLREPAAIDQARSSGFEGYTAAQQMGRMMWLNNGRVIQCEAGQPASCEGQPDGPYTPPTATARAEVRAAINLAVNRDELNQRLYDGLGKPGSELFQEDFRLDPGVAGVEYDLDEARALVDQAKGDGWDGKVRIACSTAEADRAVAVAAQLEAAGMEVDVNTQLDSAGMIDIVNVRGEFDIACTGLPISADDLGLINGIEGNFSSTSPRNRTGYANDAMDEAVQQLHVAIGDDDKRAALEAVAEQYAVDLPWLVEGAVDEMVAWNKKVHGITATQSTAVYLDKAWLS